MEYGIIYVIQITQCQKRWHEKMLTTTAVISYTISYSVTQRYLNSLHVKFHTCPHGNSLAAKRKQIFPNGFEKM